ncbi:acylphosphatase [Thermolongibacillus altinsuensis]
MIRYHVFVDGRVQGVGFRYFTQHEAIKRNLTGWVRNLEDGRVELQVQGDAEKVEQFVQQIKKGSPFSRIEKVDIHSISPVQNEKGYRILY